MISKLLVVLVVVLPPCCQNDSDLLPLRGSPLHQMEAATSATQSCKKKPLDACMMVTTLPREETRATSTHYQNQRRQLVHQKQLQREKISPEMEVALRYKIVFTVYTVCTVHTVYMRC